MENKISANYILGNVQLYSVHGAHPQFNVIILQMLKLVQRVSKTLPEVAQ